MVNCREGETFVLVLSLPGVTGHQFATSGWRHTTGLQSNEDCRGYHWVGQHKTQKMIQKIIQITQLYANHAFCLKGYRSKVLGHNSIEVIWKHPCDKKKHG